MANARTNALWICGVALLAAGAAGTILASAQGRASGQTAGQEQFTTRIVTSGLDSPWELTWGPDDQLWVTERRGRRVLRINPVDGSAVVAVTIPESHQSVAQDGLLGLALHPGLLRGTGSDYAYVAFTYDDAPGAALVRRMAVRRYTYDPRSGRLMAPLDLLLGLPTHDDHLAGRLVFGPDEKLYLSIGDEGSNFGQNRCNANRAQELPTAADVRAGRWSGYQGKILRMNLDGSIPPDNPVIAGVRSHVFSYGHRNPQGLVFGAGGRLYESEHGPNTDDEVNLIEPAGNYGWPFVAGFRDDKVYVYANWSASRPEPCASLPPGANTVPASVPTQRETAWTHADFRPPLQTFFTVDQGYDFQKQGGATIAPGSLDIVTDNRGVPGWATSLLVPSLLKGLVYRLALSADGRSVSGPPLEYFKTTNRYRDIAVHPDQRTFYVATDPDGRATDAAGLSTQSLSNRGAILEFKYLDASTGGAR